MFDLFFYTLCGIAIICAFFQETRLVSYAILILAFVSSIIYHLILNDFFLVSFSAVMLDQSLSLSDASKKLKC